jgi:hypothetical protein
MCDVDRQDILTIYNRMAIVDSQGITRWANHKISSKGPWIS